jgi:hypothetical protein
MSATRTYIKNEDGHYVCPFCGDIKKNQSTMFYHMNKHEGRLPHQCGQCSKAFVQKQELALHILKWHPEPTVDSSTACPFDGCDFKDVRKGNVRTHCMRKHVSEYMDGILVKDADGTWNCSLCATCCSSAAGFYYHLYKCMMDYEIIVADSEVGAKLARLM